MFIEKKEQGHLIGLSLYRDRDTLFNRELLPKKSGIHIASGDRDTLFNRELLLMSYLAPYEPV